MPTSITAKTRFSPIKLAALLTGGLLVASLTACGGSDDKPSAAESVACTWTKDSGSTVAKKADLPPDQANQVGQVAATIVTSAGDVPITLDADKAPCTVTSFVSLANQGYFDNTPCHRLTTAGIMVLQCGDPSGTGAGGPGYKFPDELSKDGDTYPAGTLAMANAGADTNGSQFFLCYGDCSALDQQPNYTVFGTISDDGMAVLKQIADKGTVDGSSDGAPKAKPMIQSVSIG